MDQGHDSSDAPSVIRRRRKIARQSRDKTPEPRAFEGQYSDEESSAIEPVNVSMQIRPPGSISAHESKILRRRDKTFSGTAARSHSQPRQAEKLSEPEVADLMRVAKRSLSSPRHKEDSSESELYHGEREHRSSSARRYPSPPQPAQKTAPHTDDEKLSRLEQNLLRFEEERRRFELDKRRFEKEKREHKIRYKQVMDAEERRKMLESYRKTSDRISFPTEAEERRRLTQSLRQAYREAPVKKHHQKFSEYESSTALSSSESEAVYTDGRKQPANRAPAASQERKSVSRNGSMSPIRQGDHEIGARPPVPQRRSVSRNNSLSPIRTKPDSRQPTPTPPERKSVSRNASLSPIRGKTPESRHQTPPVPERKKLSRNSSLSPVRTTPAQQEEIREIQEVKDHTPARKSSISSVDHGKVRRRKSSRVSDSEKEHVTLRRKTSLPKAQTSVEEVKPEAEETQPKPEQKPKQSLVGRLLSIFKRQKKDVKEDDVSVPAEKVVVKGRLRAFIGQMYGECSYEWKRLKADYPEEVAKFRIQRNTCLSHLIILVLFCGFGGLLFRYTEGTLENIYKCEVRKVKRDFIDHLWGISHNTREDDWKTIARNKLRKFEEELINFHELAGRTFPGKKSWNFVNSVVFCWTVVTTIGYGHIVPQTILGRSLTIVYAIIGIPMFLILLADFGKVFTRGIKFIWAYVRRLYYTGTCRKVRKQQQVQDMISGFNAMYDIAMRRPSQLPPNTEVEDVEKSGGTVPVVPQSSHLSLHPSNTETPTTPYPETIEIDDEFNLPISLASAILITYILVGASVYSIWEDWDYFESFYFVFVSMSTIGFGDFVPNHPIFMMCSIIYLVFGLALTSMFINVVQIKLSDTFKDASAKIGATIGLSMAEEAQSHIQTPTPELASVHTGPRLEPMPEIRTPETAAETPSGPPPLPKRFVGVPAEEPDHKKSKKKFFKL